MVVKNSFLLVFVIFFYSFSEAKKEIVLKDDPELLKEEKSPNCSSGFPELLQNEDSIQYEGVKYDREKEQYLKTKYSPYFKLYDNETLKGPAKAEVNKEGFFINGEQKCSWTSKRTKCSEVSSEFSYCWLVKAEKVNPRIGEKPCEFIKNYWGKFKIEEITDTYYTMKIADKKYYVSRKETPQYEYIESRDKKAEGLKKKLLAKINKNFKKHQSDFLEFVEKEKVCLKSEDKNCKPENGLDFINFVDYLCYDKKIECPKKVIEWRVADPQAEPYYVASLPECFDFSKMQVEITKYGGEDEFQIFSIPKGYDRNVICAYDIKLNEDKKDEIKLNLKVRIEVPEGATYHDIDKGITYGDRDDEEFQKEKTMGSINRSCNEILGHSRVIPSRIHDKNLQKWE